MLARLNRWGRYICELWFFIARVLYFHWYNARYIIILGGPGAGKGTMSLKLSEKLGIKPLNMGALFRREIANDTRIGRTWKSTIEAGHLASDYVTFRLLRPELRKKEYRNGAIFDGVPRTLSQAKKLEFLLLLWGHKIDTIVILDVNEDDLMERLPNRRMCSNKDCGRTYHLTLNPSKVEGICDVCGHELKQRDDDKPEVVKERLSVFRANAAEIKDFYKGARNVVTVKMDNSISADEAFKNLLFAIEQVG